MLSSYPTCCITNDKDIGLLNAVIVFFVTFNYLFFIVYVNVFLHMFLVQIDKPPMQLNLNMFSLTMLLVFTFL